MPGEPTKEQVQAHPLIGQTHKESDVRKYLPATRTDEAASWDKTRTPEEIARLKEAGAFVELMQWRGHRSNPVGMADDGYVLDYRLVDAGKGPVQLERRPQDHDAEVHVRPCESRCEGACARGCRQPVEAARADPGRQRRGLRSGRGLEEGRRPSPGACSHAPTRAVRRRTMPTSAASGRMVSGRCCGRASSTPGMPTTTRP